MKSTDEELVCATLNGDQTAFGALVRKYQSAVYGLTYSLVGNFSDAEYLTQETFIRAYLLDETFLSFHSLRFERFERLT